MSDKCPVCGGTGEVDWPGGYSIPVGWLPHNKGCSLVISEGELGCDCWEPGVSEDLEREPLTEWKVKE